MPRLKDIEAVDIYPDFTVTFSSLPKCFNHFKKESKKCLKCFNKSNCRYFTRKATQGYKRYP